MSRIQGIKNLVLKPVLYISLSAMALISCDKAETSKQNQPTEVRTSFDNWGFIDEVKYFATDNPIALELGDFDGDGDLDIAVATNYGGLKIYENRIPRKE